MTTDKLDLLCQSILADPVTQEYWCEQTPREEGEVGTNYHAIEVAYNVGVTDPVESTAMKMLQDLAVEGVKGVKTIKRYLLQGQLDVNQLEVICSRLLVNPIIQHVVKSEDFGFPENPQYRFRLEHVDISDGSVPNVVEKWIGISYPIGKPNNQKGRIYRWRKDTTRGWN